MSPEAERDLSIAEVAARSGVGVATLRQWEHRHGFPSPSRLPGGRRRYREDDVEAVVAVAAERRAGRGLEAAIAAVRARADRAEDATIFAGLRRRHPEIAPMLLERRAMLAVSRAIEDECSAAGDRAHLAVAFQRAATYEAARRRRWDGLSRTAVSTLVFADFARSRRRRPNVVEVAIASGEPQGREWAVVCDGPASAAVLAGWERPDGRFEAVWTVDPVTVRAATEIAQSLARRRAPALDVVHAPDWPARPGGPELRRAVTVANRVVGRLGTRR